MTCQATVCRSSALAATGHRPSLLTSSSPGGANPIGPTLIPCVWAVQNALMLPTYNNRVRYVCAGVDATKTPRSTFNKQGVDISFADYLKCVPRTCLAMLDLVDPHRDWKGNQQCCTGHVYCSCHNSSRWATLNKPCINAASISSALIAAVAPQMCGRPCMAV